MKSSTRLYVQLAVVLALMIGFSGVAEANSPATVKNNTCCVYIVTYVTDSNTVFGPDTLSPNESYDIKVPAGEEIVKIIINGTSFDAQIPVGSCEDLGVSALCICAPSTNEFCRRDDQVWVLRP